MVETKGKEPASKFESLEEGMPVNSVPRLCPRYKADMTVEEWGEF